jgi:hypothetical protein
VKQGRENDRIKSIVHTSTNIALAFFIDGLFDRSVATDDSFLGRSEKAWQ